LRIEALLRRQNDILFVPASAFMTCDCSNWTGRLGVCVVTSALGGIHLLNRPYDAKFGSAPILVITGLLHRARR
jgi:thiamine pyrophosphate-dependent acetolactate synthase large subunit-like protein